jgi:hypothetical protein
VKGLRGDSLRLEQVQHGLGVPQPTGPGLAEGQLHRAGPVAGPAAEDETAEAAQQQIEKARDRLSDAPPGKSLDDASAPPLRALDRLPRALHQHYEEAPSGGRRGRRSPELCCYFK